MERSFWSTCLQPLCCLFERNRPCPGTCQHNSRKLFAIVQNTGCLRENFLIPHVLGCQNCEVLTFRAEKKTAVIVSLFAFSTSVTEVHKINGNFWRSQLICFVSKTYVKAVQIMKITFEREWHQCTTSPKHSKLIRVNSASICVCFLCCIFTFGNFVLASPYVCMFFSFIFFDVFPNNFWGCIVSRP